jgi:hypothetical protein
MNVPATFNTNITLVNNTEVTFANAGVYNVEFSLQLQIIQGGGETVRIWYRKSGVDVPDSSTDIELKNTNEYYVASWNFLDQYNAGDYF